MDYKKLNDLLIGYLVELINDYGTINTLSQYPFDLTKDDLLELGFDLYQIDEALS